MFGNSLENLGKSTGECKKKHSDKFPKFVNIFGNLFKSSEIFGSLQKSLEKIRECCKVLKMTYWLFFIFLKNVRKLLEVIRHLWKSSGNFEIVAKCLKQPSSILESFLKSSKIVGSLRKSSEFFRKNWKMSESSQNNLLTIFANFRKFLEIFRNVRKCSENFGNPQKIFEYGQRFTKSSKTFQSLTPLD